MCFLYTPEAEVEPEGDSSALRTVRSWPPVTPGFALVWGWGVLVC